MRTVQLELRLWLQRLPLLRAKLRPALLLRLRLERSWTNVICDGSFYSCCACLFSEELEALMLLGMAAATA